MSKTLVGTKTVNSIQELRSLLADLASGDCCYFARWAHRVSGMVKAIDDVLLEPDGSPEGQMFGHNFEVRWKKISQQCYEVLLLHCDKSVTEWQFTPVGNGWQVPATPLNSHFYDADETRFPQGFELAKKIKLQQRYFQDAMTATVHFVALTIVSSR
jgi:hypothetical protein